MGDNSKYWDTIKKIFKIQKEAKPRNEIGNNAKQLKQGNIKK